MIYANRFKSPKLSGYSPAHPQLWAQAPPEASCSHVPRYSSSLLVPSSSPSSVGTCGRSLGCELRCLTWGGRQALPLGLPARLWIPPSQWLLVLSRGLQLLSPSPQPKSKCLSGPPASTLVSHWQPEQLSTYKSHHIPPP